MFIFSPTATNMFYITITNNVVKISSLLSWAGERTDESPQVWVHSQETALTTRCGAEGRANTQSRGHSWLQPDYLEIKICLSLIKFLTEYSKGPPSNQRHQPGNNSSISGSSCSQPSSRSSQSNSCRDRGGQESKPTRYNREINWTWNYINISQLLIP